jgi:lipoate-protein ligase A
MEGLIVLAPAEPYVCIGYHQDAALELDLAYCREQEIPVFRREVGGGAVYLDGDQLFYQLVLHRHNPLAAGDKSEFYRRLLAPVVQTYRDLGVDVHYRPVNDIVTTEGRKISGNGAAQMGDYAVLVGNLIADFDYKTMTRVLRVPDAKFRDKVFKSLGENLTTLRRELGQVPNWEAMTDTLVRNFETALGPLEPAQLPQSVHHTASELARTHTTEDWLLRRDSRNRTERKSAANLARSVRIAEGVNVVQRVHKAPGGMIRATVEEQHGQIASLSLSGDFFFYPAGHLELLESYLLGTAIARAESAVERFYRDNGIESPGLTPRDWAIVLGVP